MMCLASPAVQMQENKDKALLSTVSGFLSLLTGSFVSCKVTRRREMLMFVITHLSVTH